MTDKKVWENLLAASKALLCELSACDDFDCWCEPGDYGCEPGAAYQPPITCEACVLRRAIAEVEKQKED